MKQKSKFQRVYPGGPDACVVCRHPKLDHINDSLYNNRTFGKPTLQQICDELNKAYPEITPILKTPYLTQHKSHAILTGHSNVTKKATPFGPAANQAPNVSEKLLVQNPLDLLPRIRTAFELGLQNMIDNPKSITPNATLQLANLLVKLEPPSQSKSFEDAWSGFTKARSQEEQTFKQTEEEGDDSVPSTNSLADNLDEFAEGVKDSEEGID